MRVIPGRRTTTTGLQAALAALQERFGQGAVLLLGDDAVDGAPVRGVGTGSRALDGALGGAGWPRGRIAELVGPESAGKTTLALAAVAAAQQDGGVAAWVDVDRGLDLRFAARAGARLERLVVAQPASAEESFVVVAQLVRSGGVELVVVDSTAALVPAADVAVDDPAAPVASAGRALAAFLKRLQPLVAATDCAVLFLSQLRAGRGDGKPAEYVAGGGPLLFHAAVRVELRREAFIAEGGVVVGACSRAVVVKNKLGPPYREATLRLRFGVGIEDDAAPAADAAA